MSAKDVLDAAIFAVAFAGSWLGWYLAGKGAGRREATARINAELTKLQDSGFITVHVNGDQVLTVDGTTTHGRIRARIAVN